MAVPRPALEPGADPTQVPTDRGGRHAPAVHGTLLAVQIAFASLAVAGKLVFRTLEPGALALIRLAGTALVFWALSGGTRSIRSLPARDVLQIAGCALLGIFGNQVLFLYGLRETTAVNAVLLIATIPVFTVLVAIVTGRERARPRTLGGVALAFVGVAWLVRGDLDLGTSTVVGDLLVVGNSIVYAIYLVLVRDLVAKHGSLPVVTIGFTFGALFALPIGLPALIVQAPSIDPQIWALVGYVVLVPTVFTYLANAWALRRAPSSIVAVYIYAQPPVAAALAWAFLGEAPSPSIAITVVAVFVGIWLSTHEARRKVPEPRVVETSRSGTSAPLTPQ